MPGGPPLKGRRVHDRTSPHRYEPGDYGWWSEGGAWFCRVPGSAIEEGVPGTGNLSLHDVVEHEDGSITASPSILMEGYGGWSGWHGLLERGHWRSV